MMLKPNSSGFCNLYQVNVKTFIWKMNCLDVSVYVALYLQDDVFSQLENW